MTISISGIVAKWHEQKEKAVDEIVYYVEEGSTGNGIRR